MDPALLSQLITLSALLMFVISGWAVYWIWTAKRSGWMRLAASYVDQQGYHTTPHRFEKIRLLPAHVMYWHTVNVCCGIDGLHIWTLLPCRFGHESLMVPWDDIDILAVETYPADRVYDLEFSKVPGVRLRVGVHVAQQIRRATDNVQYFVEKPGENTNSLTTAPTSRTI